MINVVIVKKIPGKKIARSAQQNATFEGVPSVGEMVDDWVVDRVYWRRFQQGRGAYTPHIVLVPLDRDTVMINGGHR